LGPECYPVVHLLLWGGYFIILYYIVARTYDEKDTILESGIMEQVENEFRAKGIRAGTDQRPGRRPGNTPVE